jgi:O-antigen/teichoic acid export membrane protein
MAGVGGGRDRAKGVVAVVLVLVAFLVVATLGTVPPLWLLALVVLGVAALVGRVVRRGHRWIAFLGLGLALVAIAIAVLALYAADDPWADLVLVIWVIVLGTMGCAWGVGIWVGRHWRSRRAPSEGAAPGR